MRQIETRMGIPISIDIPRCNDESIFKQAFKVLSNIDEQFSPYKSSSELSRFQRGEIKPVDLSPKMRQIKKTCDNLQQKTGGYFSAYFDNGVFNPTGYVKGWAIMQTAKLISKTGWKTFIINAGGDIVAKSSGAKKWNIALQHPLNKQASFGTITAGNIAIATSGNYERGQHIINPKIAKPATTLLLATVVGQDIATADAYSTALFAMGPSGIDFINAQPDFAALIVLPDLTIKTSDNFAKFIKG